MFTLAHISDLHLGPLPYVRASQLFSKRITGYINWKRNRSAVDPKEVIGKLIAHHKTLNVDHTAITGDLINLGLPLEIENARKWMEGFADPNNATLVCGNHDAYVKGALSTAFKQWQPWIADDKQSEISDNEDFPTLRRRGNISLVSCNSAVATLPFLATGKFTKSQGEKLARLLEQEKGRCRVVMIHHPPFPNATHHHKRLIGVENFMDAIRSSGAELILHGHTHLETVNYIEGRNANVPIVCAPAAYQWVGHKKPAAAINKFEIETARDGNWKIALERHSLIQDGGFNVTLKQTLNG